MNSKYTQPPEKTHLQGFQDAFDTYVKALGSVAEDTAKRVVEAHQKYLDRGLDAARNPAEASQIVQSSMQE
ncbi:hypothetical protein NL529_27985, partial [Klebsiella pneumoniae]|nr:hypothetical protein [Klebsiella pneumoniae]